MSSMEGPHANEEPARSGGNQLCVSNWALRRIEREQKREQDLKQDRHETCLDSDKSSSQGERTVSCVLKPSYHSDCESKEEQIPEPSFHSERSAPKKGLQPQIPK
nr:hypothetical protein CFP56_24917 [Quercus suber]